MDKHIDLKSNNKGLSLIELLIVVAIMTIIGGTVFLSTSVATNRHVTSCANKISTAFEQTRNLTLGKQSGKIKFWVGSDGQVYAQMYVDGTTYGDQVAIGHSGITVTFVYVNPLNAGIVYHQDLTTTGMEISFSRSTGGITSQMFDGSAIDPSAKKLKAIVVTNGNRSITIEVDSYTGRVNIIN